MAFVFTIPEDEPTEFEIFTNGSDAVVQTTIGYDDITENTYSVFVTLSPQGGGDLELAFCLIESDVDEASEHTYWDGSQTRALIPLSADRARIVAAICTAVKILINRVSPPVVYHSTHAADLPDEALKKHLAVNGVFANHGYLVEEGEVHHGRRLWIMERAAS